MRHGLNYLDHLTPDLLPPTIRKRCMQVCREIVFHWGPFQSGLQCHKSSIIRLDTTLELVGLNVLASPLSILSAMVASATYELKAFAVLTFFCAIKLPGKNRRAKRIELVTSLIAQLMEFIAHNRDFVTRDQDDIDVGVFTMVIGGCMDGHGVEKEPDPGPISD